MYTNLANVKQCDACHKTIGVNQEFILVRAHKSHTQKDRYRVESKRMPVYAKRVITPQGQLVSEMDLCVQCWEQLEEYVKGIAP